MLFAERRVCRCSEDDSLSGLSLLDDRLLLALIIWALLLSLVVFFVIVAIAVERTLPPLIRLPSSGHVPLDTESSTVDSSSLSADVTPTRQSPAVVRRSSTNSQPETWLRYLRDENWILYPSSTTVVSRRRSQSADQRSLYELNQTRQGVLESNTPY